MSTNRNLKMEQDLFANLPQEMTINILSRLPILTTIWCKCVCKSWLHLVETPEFVKCRVSHSIPGLAVFKGNESSKPYEVYEFADELDREYSKRYFNLAMKFSFPHHELIHSSVNGLLVLGLHPVLANNHRPLNLLICNPITQEYIKLPDPPFPARLHKKQFQFSTYGFGVSKMSDQYKVVRIFNNHFLNEERDRWEGQYQVGCQVYTLGTGSWRSIASTATGSINFEIIRLTVGAFLNGNLHLLVRDKDASPRVACFDLETELLSTFSPPPPLRGISSRTSISALRDCLCVLETSTVNETHIWLMNSYGDEKSWTEQFFISSTCGGQKIRRELIRPVKVFKDGDILFARDDFCCSNLLFYSSKTNTQGDTGLLTDYNYIAFSRTSVVTYTPSFLSLKTFTMEKVSSFGSEQPHQRSMKRKISG